MYLHSILNYLTGEGKLNKTHHVLLKMRKNENIFKKMNLFLLDC